MQHRMEAIEINNSSESHLSRSVIKLYGYQTSECGYCKKGEGSSYGIMAEERSMRPSDYDFMMCRGWRRCGTYFYKPTMHKVSSSVVIS